MKGLLDLFLELVKIPSPSGDEQRLAEYIFDRLSNLGGDCIIDRSGPDTGSNTGNVYACFGDDPIILLSAHMDTVTVGSTKIEPEIKDGIIRSKGNTNLGADDKSGIALILFLLETLKREKMLDRIEVLFTVCEEVGLLGAKAFDRSMIRSSYGLFLDNEGFPLAVVASPTHLKLSWDIKGRAAHAGANPESGISAVEIAARAISQMRLGRIDEDTTANIGRLKGGVARNVVPPDIRVEGEARSHDNKKLSMIVEDMHQLFLKEAKKAWDKDFNSDCVKFTKELEYRKNCVKRDNPLIILFDKVSNELGYTMEFVKTGSGSDANVFGNLGIVSIVLGTGMRATHSSDEFLPVDDFVGCFKILHKTVKRWLKGD